MRRVAVIGAGAVGACIGYYLAREGADVTIVDAGRPGQLTTSATFGWVNASNKLDHPAYFDLNFAGLREYDHLVAELAHVPWWNPTGHVRCDYRDERELANHVEQLNARHYPAEVWTAERVQELLEPNLAFVAASPLVVVFPSEAWVDGPQMAQALADAAVKNGATTAFGSPVSNITVTDRAVASIELTSGEKYAVEIVVNAAGPLARDVAALVGRVLPMKDQPGLAVRVGMRNGLVRRVLHAPEIAIRPDGPSRGFLLARGVEPALTDARHPYTDLVATVTSIAARVFPELGRAPVVSAQVGRRVIPVDGFPVLGKAGDIDGYYEAVTHSGITLAPIVARALTAEIMYGYVDPVVSDFRASRVGST